MHNIELGKSSEYRDTYDPSLLAPIPRAQARQALPEHDGSFNGCDVWTAYELSWLNQKGVPQVAIAEFLFDSASLCIIESKSFKYYLNSFNQTPFSCWDAVRERMALDLETASGGKVSISLIPLDNGFDVVAPLKGVCVDSIECQIECYQPDATLLEFGGKSVKNEQLFSHLLKSNCPVTGQPDWATIWVQYSGKKLSEQSFLKYVVAFRQYQGFHESCVERIYCDLLTQGELSELCVYARYTRRGGLDINPMRYSPGFNADSVPFGRLVRQ